jgi:hypothetical protein
VRGEERWRPCDSAKRQTKRTLNPFYAPAQILADDRASVPNPCPNVREPAHEAMQVVPVRNTRNAWSEATSRHFGPLPA